MKITDNIEIYKGDCLIESDKIESGSVDLILTDLPYGTVKNIANSENINHGMSGKCEWDSVINTDKIMQIANRILRKNGKMILFAQQPFTNELINKSVANVRFNYSMIWEKDHFANALTAKKAPLNYYEDVLVYSKTHDFEGIHPLRPYFKKIYEFINHTKKTILSQIGQKADHVFRFNSSQFSLCTEETYKKLIELYRIDKMVEFRTFNDILKESDNMVSTFNLWEGNKVKSNILKYKKDYNGYHPTQKPVLLLEDLIKTFSNKGNTVVDLTMGSGSTGVACVNSNRNFTGIEQDEKYFEIAKTRINNAIGQTKLF
jgi:DNA modification methylase